ncbi:MAG: helix-turn-helix domain-containing protein [Nitrospirales bacterium]|nr:helix-turn-helix domain-containing protein [Nitrospirales bacterium]
MAPVHYVQAWRQARQYTITALATKSGIEPKVLEAFEAGAIDPPVSMLQTVAQVLAIPLGWLFSSPQSFEALFSDPDEDETSFSAINNPDPVTERILLASQHEQEIYVLLTALLQSGDPKLVRAAEVSLRSLLKQARLSAIPWGARPSGHFEPPND